MKRNKIKFIILFIAILTYLISTVLSYYPQFIKTFYSDNLNKWWIQQLSQITGNFPFSLFECLIYLILLGICLSLILLIKKLTLNPASWFKIVYQFLLTLITSGSLLYIIFIWFWGLNYHRPSLETDFGLSSRQYTQMELIDLYIDLTKETNESRLLVQENEEGIFIANGDYHDIFNRASVGYDQASNIYPFLAGDYGNPKPILASSLMNYTNITGIYSPFTAEANVNIAVPDSTLLFTTMHEMAHQRGYASENEANFIAFITCIHHTDTDFIYSGYLSALRYTNIALSKVNPQVLMSLNEQLHEGVKRDLRYLNTFWAQYEGKVEKTFNNMNQTYLTLNGVSDGVKSYGRVVDLLLAYYDSQNTLVN